MMCPMCGAENAVIEHDLETYYPKDGGAPFSFGTKYIRCLVCTEETSCSEFNDASFLIAEKLYTNPRTLEEG